MKFQRETKKKGKIKVQHLIIGKERVYTHERKDLSFSCRLFIRLLGFTSFLLW